MIRKNKRLIKHMAFTLVELLTVIFIIGIISVMVIPTIEKTTKQSREELYQAQLQNIITGAKNWSVKNHTILPEQDGEMITITLSQLKIDGFIDNDIQNPRTKKKFPNDLEITITKKSNNYEYIVLEDSGGNSNEVDFNSPTIIINGSVHEIVEINTEYIDKGVIAKDPSGAIIDVVDVSITTDGKKVDSVDTSLFVQYKITYVVNYEGIMSSAVRTVTVKDTTPPILIVPKDVVIGVDDVPKFDPKDGVISTDNSLQATDVTVTGTLSQLPGVYYIEYKAVDSSGNETIKLRKVTVISMSQYTDSSGAPSPILADGMIPIMWDGTKWIKADIYEKWYDYNAKEWANVVLVTPETRIVYQEAPLGTVIKDSDVLAYLVWIPRYRYKIFNTEAIYMANYQEIEIKFENKTSEKLISAANGGWLTHPAFTFGEEELDGFWVGKFEMTGNVDSPTVKPNISSITNQNYNNMFYTSLLFNSEKYINSPKNVNFHMINNIKWGAIAYLTQSKYGKNSEVWINPSSSYITGCAGTSSSVSSSSGCLYSYTTSNGRQASTTGNVYGVYDMSGGAAEMVMGGMRGSDNNAIILSSSGLPPLTIEKLNMDKYITKYTYGTTTSDQAAYNRRQLGDATGETRGWYSDSAYFITSTFSWFIRGGAYNNTSSAGIFNFITTTGIETVNQGTRIVGVNSLYDLDEYPHPCYDEIIKDWVC